MADDSPAKPEIDTAANTADTTPSDHGPDTTSNGSIVTQEDEKEATGEDIVFGTVDPDILATEDAAPPAKEDTAPPATEDADPPAKEDAAPPAQEDTAPPATEDADPPATEDADPPATEDAAPPAKEDAAPPATEAADPPAEEDAASPATEDVAPPAQEDAVSPAQEDAVSPAQEDAVSPAQEEEESEPRALKESDPAPTEIDTTTELGRIATQLIPHLLNLYKSTPTAHDFDVLYAPDATFEDPLMQAHGVAQIKSAFYAMPKVFLDTTILSYTVEEEETSPSSGEIRLDNLQQIKLLQLGPFGYYTTVHSLIKLTVENGKVVRHEDLWGGYRLWNKHTVWVPFVGRVAEIIRKGSMLLTHILMGFGRDHKTLDKDSCFHLKVA